MGSTTTMRRLLAAVPALFVSRVPAGVFAHGGHVNLLHGCVSKNKGGGAMSRHLCLALLVILGFLLGGAPRRPGRRFFYLHAYRCP